MMACTQKSDCNSCRPGFGGVIITLTAPACTKCTSGTYAAGYKVGGEACSSCPKPTGYTGTMVSRNVSCWACLVASFSAWLLCLLCSWSLLCSWIPAELHSSPPAAPQPQQSALTRPHAPSSSTPLLAFLLHRASSPPRTALESSPPTAPTISLTGTSSAWPPAC
jgi:hypothetical protein